MIYLLQEQIYLSFISMLCQSNDEVTKYTSLLLESRFLLKIFDFFTKQVKTRRKLILESLKRIEGQYKYFTIHPGLVVDLIK